MFVKSQISSSELKELGSTLSHSSTGPATADMIPQNSVGVGTVLRGKLAYYGESLTNHSRMSTVVKPSIENEVAP